MDKADYVFAPHGTAPAGPCAICGYPDKRHRMWDMIRGRFAAGDSIALLAKDYDHTRREIEQWLRLSLTAPRRPRTRKAESTESLAKGSCVHGRGTREEGQS